MERIWVKDLQVGQQVAGVFEVARKQEATGKNGRVFLKLTLQDKTGQLDARVWNDAEEVGSRFEAGDRVEVEGQTVSFQRAPQLTIEKLEKSTAELDPADFACEPPPKPAEARKAAGGAASESQFHALRAELVRVSDPLVRALLLAFLDDPELVSKLRRSPASRERHYAYPGGLLDHLLSCVRLAGRLADHYPMADRDLLMAGAFLREIDVTARLSFEKGPGGQTDEGLLVGPGVIAAGWIRDKARAITGFPQELELHLLHLVLASREERAAGGTTLEGFLVARLSELDATLNEMLGQMAKGAANVKWSSPMKGSEVRIWKAAAPTEGGKRQGPPARGQGRRRGTRKEVEVATVERPKKERPQRASEKRQAEAPSPAAASTPASAPAADAGGGRRGPKILKPAQAATKAQPPQKLTFKPFSAFTGEEEEEKAGPAEKEESTTPAAGFPADEGAPSSGPEATVGASEQEAEVPTKTAAGEKAVEATEATAATEAATSAPPKQVSDATAPEMKPPADQVEATSAAQSEAKSSVVPEGISVSTSPPTPGTRTEGTPEGQTELKPAAAPVAEPREPGTAPAQASEPKSSPPQKTTDAIGGSDEAKEEAAAKRPPPEEEAGQPQETTAAVEGTPPEGGDKDPA